MNDAEFEAEKARVKGYFDRWIRPLGLGYWRWKFEWHREPPPGDPNEAAETLMNINPLWQYLEAAVNVYLPATEKLTDEVIEQDVVHELCHALIAEVSGKKTSPDQVERVTSSLASAFIWIRDRTAVGQTPHPDAPEDLPAKSGLRSVVAPRTRAQVNDCGRCEKAKEYRCERCPTLVPGEWHRLQGFTPECG